MAGRREAPTGVRSYRSCGCWDLDACWDEEKGPCWWIEDDLCSRCAEPVTGAASLSRCQRELAGVIDELTQIFDRPPTYREAGHELGTSAGNVYQVATRMYEKGWIARAKNGDPMKLILARPVRPLRELPCELTEAGRRALAEWSGG